MRAKERRNNISYCERRVTVAGGVLMLSLVPAALGIRQVQRAQAFSLLADGNRTMSLSKTYDAKAAAMQLKTVVDQVI